MNRTFAFLAALAALAAFAPTTALADHCDGDACACPDYSYEIGAAGSSLRYNEQGQSLLAAHNPATGETWYVAVDEVAFLTPHGDDTLVSIWVYPESNGAPGLQRSDTYCSNCDPSECEPDILVP